MILPSEVVEGATATLASTLFAPVRLFGGRAASAPSTTLRAVPLPREERGRT